MRTMFEDVLTTRAESRWWWWRVEERDSERTGDRDGENDESGNNGVLKLMSRHG